MATVENINPLTPASTECERSVSRTFAEVLPHRMVAKVKLESLRRARTARAWALPPADSTSSRSRLLLNTARLSPENAAACVMQRPIPIQVARFIEAAEADRTADNRRRSA